MRQCSKGKSILRKQHGAAAVEFALVLPLLLILVFGIVEFSLALYDKAIITNASREGARAGIVFADPPIPDSDIKDIVIAYCGERLVNFPSRNVTAGDIVITRAGSAPGDELTVQVSYNYDYLLLPAFISALTDGINMTTRTVMRME